MAYVLSGPTSPLAFSESVICIINQSAKQVENKEHLWRMWSIVVNPLTEWINQVWWFFVPHLPPKNPQENLVLIFQCIFRNYMSWSDGKIA